MFGINVDQVKSFIRSTIIALGGFVVAKGWLDTQTLTEVAGAVAAVGAAIWGIWFHAGATKDNLEKVVVGIADPAVIQSTDAKAAAAQGIH